ncbi:hypothetical protein [Carboxylicivirga marina]|uniref:Transglutaminase-like domain-containing protein n=1 Tax=Carboxylicivirga marina TaxID=2800988 RepID=A0ABS1HIE2_9BACT|nr:hypothetical protein [Carboxylicivirga marina]MBK3516979.1 hypothetical protein [Carboxylicivirga marina]
MKQLLLLSLVLFGTLNVAFGQIDQDDPFKKMDEKYNARMQKMNQDYEANLKRMQAEYDERLKKMNQAFKKYLKKGFSEVEQTEEKVKPVEVPKPIKQPTFKPDKDIKVKPVDKLDPVEVPDRVDIPEKRDVPEELILPEPVKPDVVVAEAAAFSIAPIFKVPDGAEAYAKDLTIDFFGSPATLVADKRMSALTIKSVKPASFASYWDDFTETYYQLYIESLLEYAEEKNLNDWGIYQLIDLSSKKLHTTANGRAMWTWAMLNQAGYQAKIGYSGSSVYLLLPFMQEVYEKPFYKIDGANYYLMSGKKGIKNMMTYTKSFGGATKKVDLHLPFALNYTDTDNTVVRKTTLPNETQALQLKMDKTIMAFLASYPQTVSTVYLNAAMSANVKEALYEHIQPRIEGKSETQAVTYLLDYLHNSFEYKTDRDQFNREKMFFPDEIFYYPYSDCEDRTVLFTRLVNELLGLDAIAITYFSHMAAAVSFSGPVEGYSFLVDGRRYTITDPTYINAPIGSVMPDYEGYTPMAIKINNDSRLNNIWQTIARSLEKGNEGHIVISDRTVAENGKMMVTGWFTNDISIGGNQYSAYGGTRDLWFATFSQGGALEWFTPVNCSDNGFTQAFNAGKEGNVYALINYTGAVSVNRRKLAKSQQAAHLVLGLSNRAQPFLNENIDFEAPEGKKLAFYGKYKADGTKIDLLSFPTDKVKFDPKITIDSKNEVVVRGVVGEIEGLTKDVPILLSSASFSAEDQIESYMKVYEQQHVNRHMVALFSTLKLLSQNGGRISGITVRNLMNKNNPDFYKENPDVYKSLLSMQFVINDGGVVKVETYKGRHVSLFSMKIKNNSNLQIVKPDEETYLIKFLNGVQVGKAIVWYDLNAITFEPNGDMEFDYDTDHTKRIVSIDEVIE